VSATEARAAYVAGLLAAATITRLQLTYAFAISPESQARIITGLRDLLVPEITQAMEREEAATR
jgi:hypothetical protein